MCVQCMYTAMASTAAATGARSWLQTRRYRWLTPLRMRRITVGLVATALIASATLISGTG
jgi:hypothetical protein